MRYWRLTPEEYDQLRWDEFQAMAKVMQEEADANRKK